jgi:NAD dependent epimerase/dehydratase
MRVLVTGAGSIVGRRTADHLHAGGFNIVGTVHSRRIDAPFATVQLDLAEPWPEMGFFDAIVHVAGTLPYHGKNFCVYLRNNVDVMKRLIDYAKHHDVRRVICFSSIGIYGEIRDESIDENSDRINPDAYGLTKYAVECLLREEASIQSISLRMPGIIGSAYCGIWLPNTIEKFRRNEPVRIYSPDFATRNFVWIDDLANFVVHLLRMEEWQYDVVCLAAHEKVTVRELVHEIKSLTGSASEIIEDNDQRVSFCLDDSRAMEMGYESISPMEMVRRFLEESR